MFIQFFAFIFSRKNLHIKSIIITNAYRTQFDNEGQRLKMFSCAHIHKGWKVAERLKVVVEQSLSGIPIAGRFVYLDPI